MNKDQFESWAVVELFGHTKIAGRVSEETIGGCSFIRVDVPEHEGQPAFTKYLGNAAIYSMTPTSEEFARAALKQIRTRPVNIYMPELRQITDERPEAAGIDDVCPECGEHDCICLE